MHKMFCGMVDDMIILVGLGLFAFFGFIFVFSHFALTDGWVDGWKEPEDGNE